MYPSLLLRKSMLIPRLMLQIVAAVPSDLVPVAVSLRLNNRI